VALDIDAVEIDGVYFRHVPHGAAPLLGLEPPRDGRWQRGHAVAAVYLADSVATMWAEWYRVLAEFAVPPARALPRDVWRIAVSLERVADLSNEDRLRRLGLERPRPGRPAWAAHQEVGEALHAQGWPALIAPSAARPEGAVICVFRTAPEVRGLAPLAPPTVQDQPPPPPRERARAPRRGCRRPPARR
jgi:RES domain-containing protein